VAWKLRLLVQGVGVLGERNRFAFVVENIANPWALVGLDLRHDLDFERRVAKVCLEAGRGTLLNHHSAHLLRHTLVMPQFAASTVGMKARGRSLQFVFGCCRLELSLVGDGRPWAWFSLLWAQHLLRKVLFRVSYIELSIS
jgi:hypothetical protein